MGYTPSSKIEKFAFFIAGVKKTGSANLEAGELSPVTNYWLMRSNTATVFSTVFATLAMVLFVELKNLYFCIPFAVGFILCSIKVWVYSKCAQKTLSLWL